MNNPNSTFYQISLDEVVTSGQPTMLLFATPSNGKTCFCGPFYEIFDDIEAKHRGRMNFIHVEAFTALPNPENNNWAVSPAVENFGLESEPCRDPGI